MEIPVGLAATHFRDMCNQTELRLIHSENNMEAAHKLTLIACGAFFLIGLLTGIWKYLSIWKSPISEAPRYISVSHHASLLYSFAALVLLKFLEFSPYSDTINLVSVAVPLFFFFVAIVTYVSHGIFRDTDNQFRKPYHFGKIQIPPLVFHLLIWLLIAGEISGFLVLFIGYLSVVLAVP